MKLCWVSPKYRSTQIRQNFPFKSWGGWSFDIDHFRKKPSCLCVLDDVGMILDYFGMILDDFSWKPLTILGGL